MKRNIILIILGIVILNIAGVVYFHHRMEEKSFNMLSDHFMGKPIKPNFIERTKHLLELTDEQVEKIEEVDLRYSKMKEPYWERLKPLRLKLRENILKDKLDEEKMRKILEKMDGERRELRILFFKQKIEMEKMLSPEQKKKLRERIKNFPGRFRHRGFPRGPGEKHGLFHGRDKG